RRHRPVLAGGPRGRRRVSVGADPPGSFHGHTRRRRYRHPGAPRVRQPQGRLRDRRRIVRPRRACGFVPHRPGRFRRSQRRDGGILQPTVPGALDDRSRRPAQGRCVRGRCRDGDRLTQMPRVAQAAPALAAVGETPLVRLAGVGPRVAEKLAARGLSTLQDLWLQLPRQYEDRTRITPIRDLQPGSTAQVEGIVEAVERGFRYRPMLRVAISDTSRATLVLRFFHFRAAQVAQFVPGTRVRCYGTPRAGQHGLEIVHPSYRVLDDDASALGEQLDPVYPAIEGIGPISLRRLIGQALDRLPDEATLELLPRGLLDTLGLPSLRDALLVVHRPPRDADVGALLAGTHPAQQRLALEELLAHHLSLRRQRIALQSGGAVPFTVRGALAQRLREALPFPLTAAQQRVFAELRKDLARPVPMLRLVQGDVGSGKTVVAALAAMLAVECGKQVALMAPTELLAEQHLANFRAWLEPLGVRVAWLAGKVTGKARTSVLDAVATGAAQVVVGTHALMHEEVGFHDLGLAIVDEQHRFGVHQRLALRNKGFQGQGGREGSAPHQLVMTATPIPRTLAMTAYADLDVSAIDELPPGR